MALWFPPLGWAGEGRARGWNMELELEQPILLLGSIPVSQSGMTRLSFSGLDHHVVGPEQIWSRAIP